MQAPLAIWPQLRWLRLFFKSCIACWRGGADARRVARHTKDRHYVNCCAKTMKRFVSKLFFSFIFYLYSLSSTHHSLLSFLVPRLSSKDKHSKNKEVTFIILQKNMRSMHSSEKIEELVTELEGYRWDAILLSETWRHEPAVLWETQHNHIFMGAGKYENQHGVGIMLNKRWRKRIIDTRLHQ